MKGRDIWSSPAQVPFIFEDLYKKLCCEYYVQKTKDAKIQISTDAVNELFA